MTLAETERTIIDRITMRDAPFFVELVNTPDWIRFIGDRNVNTLDDARRYLQDGFLRSYADHGFGYYIARRKPDLAPIGIAGFLKKPSLENPDFGFALLPSYYGQGLAFEYCRAILDYGIREFGFCTLDAVTTTNNVRSKRLLTKLSFEDHGKAPCDDDDVELRLFRWCVTQ